MADSVDTGARRQKARSQKVKDGDEKGGKAKDDQTN